VCASPRGYVAVLLTSIVVVLGIDPHVGHAGQAMLGAACWGVLLLASSSLSPEQRAQVAVVVVVATTGEVLCSVVWGLYVYRLENVPMFVPPGHGMVYIGGLMFAQLGIVRERLHMVRWVATIGLGAWVVLGLMVFERRDIAGAASAIVLGWVVWRRARPDVFIGVLAFVTALELWGTSVGAWEWQHFAPGLGIEQGNPPSGVACAYVLCDYLALRAGPRVLARAGQWRVRAGQLVPALARAQGVAGQDP
jgi:hypothetical protein